MILNDWQKMKREDMPMRISPNVCSSCCFLKNVRRGCCDPLRTNLTATCYASGSKRLNCFFKCEMFLIFETYVIYRRPLLFAILGFAVLTILGLKNHKQRGKTAIFRVNLGLKYQFWYSLFEIYQERNPANSEGNLYISWWIWHLIWGCEVVEIWRLVAAEVCDSEDSPELFPIRLFVGFKDSLVRTL